MLYYTILYYAILYSTLLYYAILYSTLLYTLYYTILYYTILNLYYTILYYTIQYNTIYYILYHTILCYAIAPRCAAWPGRRLQRCTQRLRRTRRRQQPCYNIYIYIYIYVIHIYVKTYIYIYIYIYIHAHTHVYHGFNAWQARQPCQSCTRKGHRTTGHSLFLEGIPMLWFITLCPVVLRPYLCTSECVKRLQHMNTTHTILRGSHLSNTTCLTQLYSTLVNNGANLMAGGVVRHTKNKTNEAVLDK